MDSQYLNLFTLFYLNKLELNLSLLTWRRAIACPFFPPSQPVFIPAVWKIIVPPKIHVFLWLLSNNKLMTVDNLAERGIHKPLDCKFCSEKESIHHLFFECIIARQLGHTFLILMVLLSILTLIWLVNGLLRKNINPQTQSLQELFGACG